MKKNEIYLIRLKIGEVDKQNLYITAILNLKIKIMNYLPKTTRFFDPGVTAKEFSSSVGTLMVYIHKKFRTSQILTF